MTHKLKKEHLTNWDVQDFNEKPTFNGDQNSYISERPSTISPLENTPLPSSTNKQLPTPPVHILPKKPHTLRYHYNELPENGIPIATQVKSEQKEEQKRKKNFRKAPSGQGSLASFPETTQPQLGDNYYPYWYYYKAKNPDWIMRHRQNADGQLTSYDSLDPSQYVHEPGLTTTYVKPRRHHRKSHRHRDASLLSENSDQQRYETTENVSPSSKKYIPLKDAPHEAYQNEPNSPAKSPHRHKLKTENDWNDHYIQSRTSKSSQDPNNLTVETARSAHQSAKVDKNSPNGNKKHHHHRHHHRHHHASAGEYVDKEFQVVDASFKKSERTPYFQPTQNSLHSPPPSIYNQTSYLPPIRHDYYYRPSSIGYYNILSQQTLDKDRKESIETPKIYKPDPETKFYDRYLNNVIHKRLSAL